MYRVGGYIALSPSDLNDMRAFPEPEYRAILASL